jgi:ATP-binding cassette subfamily B multidrug efflux pump
MRFRLPFDRFEKLVDAFPHEPPEAPPTTFWRFLAYHLRPFRAVMGYATITGVLMAFVETGLIFYAGYVVDMLNEAGPGGLDWSHWLQLLGIAAFILVLRPIVIVLQRMLLDQGLSVNVMEMVRYRSHRHLLGQSVGFYQNDFAGRIANRVMQTAPAVEDSVVMAFEAIWYAAAYFIGAALILSQADWRLGIPMVLWLAVYVLLLKSLIPPIGAASARFSEGRSMVTGRLVDAYTNMATVKLFAHAERERAFAETAMRMTRLRFARLLRLMTTMSAGIAVVNGLLIVAVVGAAIALWSLGEVSVGVVAAASALTLRLNGMTGWIMWVTSQLFQHAGVIREGMETLTKPYDVTDAAGAKPLSVSGGKIEFHAVRHHYGRAAGGLEGVDLTINAGERVGLVGRSGAGKSTLVNLLLRFHDPEDGRIEIDGQDIATVQQESLRQRIAMVTQDTSLLHRSVRDNIRYGRPDATEADIIAAARRVKAHDFILELEDSSGRSGYDAHVGERGVKLSGGQRQRIALARAVLKDAPILVLDEATSALDSEVEAEIQEALYDLMEGKTVIAIAHRLSTIARMDRIIVLDRGLIVESGTHEDLLRQNGLYASFWGRQSGGFIGVEAA